MSKYGLQCILKLFEGATVNELSQHCTFKCYSSTAVVISEVGQDIFVVTHTQEDAKIRYPNEVINIDKK